MINLEDRVITLLRQIILIGNFITMQNAGSIQSPFLGEPVISFVYRYVKWLRILFRCSYSKNRSKQSQPFSRIKRSRFIEKPRSLQNLINWSVPKSGQDSTAPLCTISCPAFSGRVSRFSSTVAFFFELDFFTWRYSLFKFILVKRTS